MSESTTEPVEAAPLKKPHSKKKAHVALAGRTGTALGETDRLTHREASRKRPEGRRGGSPTSALDKELRSAMKRLGIAVSPANIEIFKLAAYQVVEAKLSEVAQLLRLLAPTNFEVRNSKFEMAPTPPARQAMTLENIDRMVARMDGAANSNFEIANSKLPNPNPCQWCGRPGVYKNSRGMWVCVGHRPLAVPDDQGDLLRAKLKQGFGGGDEEVIRVDAGTIQRAMAEGREEG